MSLEVGKYLLVLSLLSSRYKKMTACMKTFPRIDRTEIPTLFFLLRKWLMSDLNANISKII
jgi:hypothetical protein